MAYENIEIDVSREGVVAVLLNRPQKRNAFNAEVIEELSDALETISKNTEARLVLIRGAGPVFSAGADLEWMRAAADYTTHENEQDAYKMAEMLRRLYMLPQVTIALLHGAAMAGACGLAAAADIAVARKGTLFSFSEVKLGIIPATISPYVINAIGARWARALFVTADRFDADFAEKIGLVQYVVEDETAMEALVERLADLTFAAAPAAVAASKDLVEQVNGQVIDSSLSHKTAKLLAHRRASAQGKEGLAAFLEKRKPSWSR
ncbi:MAG: enoyl-CoA hydratase/isomerase family protein [Alphaproteobacteria bacterium]|nr:enoyl-CoA hydratase/isomerase family protein [Alphaproteobacteria bacterium]